MKKKVISIMLAALLAAGLAGCGENGNSSGNGSSGEETTTLTFLSWYSEEVYQPILDAFEEAHPEIKIEFQYAAPVDDYLEKMQVLTSTGEIPDIFYIAAENKTEMIENGYCADITDLEAVDKLVDFNRQTYESDGKVYGFAPTTWVGGYFYNKDLFNELGLEEPQTWDEFLNVCKTLQENGTRPIIERGEWFWNSFLGPFMNDYLPNDMNYHQEVIDGTKTFADGWGPYIEKWYNDLIVPGYVGEDLASMSPQEFNSEFAMGNAGLLAGHAGHLKEIRALEPDFEVGFFPMPGTEPGIKVAYGAVDCAVAISAETEHAEEAKTFLNFLAQDDIVQLYQDMNGYVIGMEGVESDVDPILEDIAESYSNGEIAVYIPQGDWGSYGTALQQELIASSQELLLGEIDCDTFIQNMQDKLDELKEK